MTMWEKFNKTKKMIELSQETSDTVTSSVENWKSYLNTASQFYKYSFDDQIMIHAQRPDCTACASIPIWNKKMLRWVKSGSKGIALIREKNQKPYLTYVFALEDTITTKISKTPYLWKMEQQHYDSVLAMLEQYEGNTKQKDIAKRLMEIAISMVDTHNSQYFKNMLPNLEDTYLASYPLLCSLEIIDEYGKLERKADMFTKRTIQKYEPITHVDTAIDALAVSISEKACVDIGFMAGLMGGSEKAEQVINDLKGLIFKTPQSGTISENSDTGWQTADEYLSGNVRMKLEQAQKMAEQYPEFESNVTALEKVQPKDLEASEIEVRIATSWIEPEYYKQFLFEYIEYQRKLCIHFI